MDVDGEDADSDIEEVPQTNGHGGQEDETPGWDPDQSIEERRNLRKEYRHLIDEAEGEL